MKYWLKIVILLLLSLGFLAPQSLAADSIQGPTMGKVSSYFGTRDDPFHGHKANHMGLDIAADAGTPVYAMQEGVVAFSGVKGGYGNCVKINQFFYMVPELPQVTTLYGHLSSVYVKEGEIVKRGQVIGLVGSTGRSTGPHLHYEVFYKGKNIDPIEYLKKLPGYLEYAAYARTNQNYYRYNASAGGKANY
ncbi:MAG: M23 family metallopeptidase [bacterium]|nr:M23 family metallopeptidase [bacterium]